MTSSDTSQAQIQGFELAHPNIYPIYELVESIKGLAVQIQSCRISMTQGTRGYLRGSPGEDPVLMVQQKSESSNKTDDSLQ